MKTVSIIVPVYNEHETIIHVLEKIQAQHVDGIAFEIIVVDDGSQDESYERLVARPDLYTRLIRRARNGGKGAAVKDGLRAASGEYVLIQDADLEYDPADYPRLFKPILLHEADVVIGSRFVAPELTRVFYFSHRIGNGLITLLFNLLNNTTFTDIYCGYLVYKRSLFDPEGLRTMGWQQHAEMLTKATRAGSILYEVPVNYHGRTYEEGKKIKARDTIAVIATIILERLRSAYALRAVTATGDDDTGPRSGSGNTDARSTNRGRRWLKMIFPLLPMLFGIFLASFYMSPTRPVYDGAQYFAMAYNMAKYNVSSVSTADTPTVKPDDLREPVTSFLISLGMRAFIDLNRHRLSCFLSPSMPCASLVNDLTYLNVVLFSAIVLMTYVAAFTITGSTLAALLASFVMASNTVLPSYMRVFTSEMPAALFVLIHAWFLFLAFKRRPRPLYALGAGIALGVLILTKAVFFYWLLLLVGILPVAILVCRRDLRKQVLVTGLVALAPACAMAGTWIARNYIDFGEAVVAQRGPIVLALRAEYTTISWRQYLGGYLFFTPYVGPELADSVFGSSVRKVFDYNQGASAIESPKHKLTVITKMYAANSNPMSGGAAAFDSLMRRESLLLMAKNWEKQIALIPLMFYRGMFIGGCCNILSNHMPPYWLTPRAHWAATLLKGLHGLQVIISLLFLTPIFLFVAVRALMKKNWPLLLFCSPALFNFAFLATLTHFNPRFSVPVLPLLTVVFSVFAVLVVRSVWHAILIGRLNKAPVTG